MEYLVNPQLTNEEPDWCGADLCGLDGCLIDVFCGAEACGVWGCAIDICPLWGAP